MNRLFRRGKEGKERSLMAAQAKLWGAESVRLHKERLRCELDLRDAMEGLSSILHTSTSTSDLPFNVAAEAVVDELAEDRAVCRALSEGMLGTVFNIRAAVSLLRANRDERRVKSIVADLQRAKAVIAEEMAVWNSPEALSSAGAKADQLSKMLGQLRVEGGDDSLLVGGSLVYPPSVSVDVPSSAASTAPLVATHHAVRNLAQLDTLVASRLEALRSRYPRAYANDDLVGVFKAAIQDVCMAARSNVSDIGVGGDDPLDESSIYEDDFEDDASEVSAPADFPTVKEKHGVPSSVASSSLRSHTSQVTFASVDDAVVARVEEIVKSFKAVSKASASLGAKGGGGTGGGVSIRDRTGHPSPLTPQQAHRSRELLHHRVKLEFPQLSSGQIIAICRAANEGAAEGRRVAGGVRVACREVHRLLDALRNALDAQEGYLRLEADRAAWREAEQQRHREQSALLDTLRAEKNERDAAALETQLAEEARRGAQLQKKTAVLEAEFQARVERMIRYREEKGRLDKEDEENRRAQAAILAAEARQQKEANQQRVAARDAKDQERLDALRLRSLEIEQEKAAQEQNMERFFARIQDKMGVQRDALRVMQPTASSTSEGNTDLIPAREAAGKSQRHNGFSDEDILKDPRFRIHEALISAGLQTTSYARTLVEKGCGYRMSAHNALSTDNPFH